MRQLRKLAAGIAVAAAVAVAASAVPALADPPVSGGKHVVPGTVDIVSVGANTDENLFNALSGAWDKTITPKQHGTAHPYIYSWNATVPGSTSSAKTTIVPKKGCATITRPNGSGAGLSALDESQVIDKTVHCIDFARSSSGRSATSPAPKVGGVGYVALATDAVTWAVRDIGGTKTVPASYAPKTLSLTQLKAIFDCSVTNWKQVGGGNAPIKAYLPQSGSGTLSFWLKKLGLTEPGACAPEVLEENQGLSKQFNSPDAIFIYSVADWISQKYRSPLPGKKATPSQNQFGTDEVGYLGLGKIAGVSPLTSAKIPTINAAFKATGFTRTIYDIVRYSNTADHIPGYLEKFLGRKGYFCSNKTAIGFIKDYGFLTTATCGSVS
jgi:ABC-type phosphate transport system substrate-binding protein